VLQRKADAEDADEDADEDAGAADAADDVSSGETPAYDIRIAVLTPR
jgi:hypothetical protein